MANAKNSSGIVERRSNTQNMGWWARSKRATRYWYLRIMRQKSSPKELAGSLALGVFIGALPIIPFQSVVVVALAFVFRVPKFAAWLATCYSNAFTMAPFYYFLFHVGDFFLPFDDLTFDPSRLEMSQLLDAGWQLFSVILAGGLLFGVPATLLTYIVSLQLIRRYRQRRAIRILSRRSRNN